MFAIQVRQGDLNGDGVDDRAHRRHIQREEHDDHHQRNEVVSESAE
jgi:hypothetical protein